MNALRRLKSWLNGPPLFLTDGVVPSREELGLPTLAEMLEQGQLDALKYSNVAGPRKPIGYDEAARHWREIQWKPANLAREARQFSRGSPRHRTTGDSWDKWRSIPDPRGRGWVVIRLGWSDWRQRAVAEFHAGPDFMRTEDPALALFWFTRFETDRVADLLNKEEAI